MSVSVCLSVCLCVCVCARARVQLTIELLTTSRRCPRRPATGEERQGANWVVEQEKTAETIEFEDEMAGAR